MVKGIAAGCTESKCALIGGETAEMPGIYQPGEYDLAGFAVGAAERGTLLPRADIAPGDIVLGLASSGVHSNGYSLVRKVVEKSGVALDAPAPFDATTTLGEALLTPTRIYVTSLLAAIRETRGVKALAHITGGGFPDNIPRVLPDTLAIQVDLAQVPVLPVFKWMAQVGQIAEAEMLRTFNCGIGMIVVVAPAEADAVSAVLARHGEKVVTLGTVGPRASGAAGRHLHRPSRARLAMPRKRVAILISGRGSNMVALIEAAKGRRLSRRNRAGDIKPRGRRWARCSRKLPASPRRQSITRNSTAASSSNTNCSAASKQTASTSSVSQVSCAC